MTRAFFQHVGQTSPSPLAIEADRADGVFIYSGDRRYLDMVSGVCVSNIGHHHPEVTAAVRAQADNYFHLMVYGEMIQAPQVLHASLLTSILPPSLDCIYYVNSGSEAVDAGAARVSAHIHPAAVAGLHLLCQFGFRGRGCSLETGQAAYWPKAFGVLRELLSRLVSYVAQSYDGS